MPRARRSTRAMATDGGVRSPPRPSPQTLADDVSTTICRSPPPMTVRLATQGSGLAVPAAPLQSASTVAGAPPSDRNTKMPAGGFAPTKVASRVRTSCSGCCAVPFGAEMLTCCPSTESPAGEPPADPVAIETAPPAGTVMAAMTGPWAVAPVPAVSVVTVPPGDVVCASVTGVVAPACGVTEPDGVDAAPGPRALVAATENV